MEDLYKDFKELTENEPKGFTYKIDSEDRGTDYVIIAIHGGQIEPGTEEVVRSIAGDDLSYYIFLGNERTQHITSIHFDEEQCNNLLSRSKSIVSIHGKKGTESFVMLGGLDSDLISKAARALASAGFAVLPPTDKVTGTQPNNVCNRGTSGKGLQIEMSRGLRDSLIQDAEKIRTFSGIIRNLITQA